MSLIDESMAEQAALDWFEELGYQRVFGPDIAPQGAEQERENYKQIVLTDRLLTALARINPHIPASILEDAARQVVHGNAPSLMQANWTCPQVTYTFWVKKRVTCRS
jgi:type I restriction enzyme R subunit